MHVVRSSGHGRIGGGGTHPLIDRIMQIHVAEEARHIGYAHAWLGEHVPRIGARGKLILGLTFPLALRIGADAIMIPSRADRHMMGVPDEVALAQAGHRRPSGALPRGAEQRRHLTLSVTSCRMDGRSARWAAHNSAQQLRIVEAALGLYDEGRLSASLQEVGERAGVTRSVVYRQFADRRDLENAVRRHILDGLWQVLQPAMEVDASQTPRQVLARAAAAYVGWAERHPRLHRLADIETDADGPLQPALDQIAETVSGLLVTWFANAGASVTKADIAAADPLAHGLVGAVFAAVRRWVRLGCEVPDAAGLVDLIVESAWAMLDARARAYGLVIDPDRPVKEQVAI